MVPRHFPRYWRFVAAHRPGDVSILRAREDAKHEALGLYVLYRGKLAAASPLRDWIVAALAEYLRPDSDLHSTGSVTGLWRRVWTSIAPRGTPWPLAKP